MKTLLYILLLLLTVPDVVFARYLHYNLDLHDGLPSNHVYNSTVDHLGYLWLCTPSGLVKYNGYEPRQINNKDVWYLYEDRKGRLWLGTISDELGYIKNDRYHAVPVKMPRGNFQPTLPWEYPFGMVFRFAHTNCIVVERNDSITVHTLKHLKQYSIPHQYTDTSIVFINRHLIREVSLRNFAIRNIGVLGINFEKTIALLHGRYLFIYNLVNGNIYVQDLRTMKERHFKLFADEEEHIYIAYTYRGVLNMITNKHWYMLGKNLELLHKVHYRQLVPVGAVNKTFISEIKQYSTWGRVMTTTANGVFIRYKGLDYERLNQELYQGYYIGRSVANNSYWWDEINKRLISIRNRRLSSMHLSDAKDMKGIVSRAGKTLAYAGDNFYWLTENPLRMKGMNYFSFPLYTAGIKDCYLHDENTIYLLSRSDGVARMNWYADTSTKRIIDSGSYRGITADTFHHRLIAYDEKKLMVYDIKTGAKHYMKGIGSVLPKLERVLIDKYGNVFVKSDDDLFLFDWKHHRLRPLFSNIRLGNAHISTDNDRLVVAGNFGVTINDIRGKNVIGRTLLYRNTKGVYYDHIYGMQAAESEILLNTNKGVLVLPYPKANLRAISVPDPYKLLVTYNDTVVNIAYMDTIKIEQSNPRLLLDAINPLGTGKLFFLYGINDHSGLSRLYSSELLLPDLEPGKFYDLYLIANDDVSKSKMANVKVYIIPYWYQTPMAKILFLVGGIMAVILLVLITIHLTRRIINRKNQQKNLLLELKNLRLDFELKSIYAQINPHFIFNTLNTGLYFIRKKKMDDAYHHISSFSDLLRSYMASSRNKFITLADEIENLQNYIMLQQARFEGRFKYKLHVGPALPVDTIVLPPFLLQPFVENAINHGLLHKEDGVGNLNIYFEQGMEKTVLICTVDDDGIGREKAKTYKNSSTPNERAHGNDLIKELIAYYNQYEQVHISIGYVDKEYPRSGTTVIVTLKNFRIEREIHMHDSG